MRIREQVSIFVLLLCLDGCWSSVLRKITSVLKQYTPEQSISRKVVYAFDKNQHRPGVNVLINGMETGNPSHLADRRCHAPPRL